MCQIINITREAFTAFQIVQAKRKAKRKLFIFRHKANRLSYELFLVDAHNIISARHCVYGCIHRMHGAVASLTLHSQL